jgi:hypothetical protein
VRSVGTRSLLIVAAPLLIGSGPSFGTITFRNALSTPVTVTESFGNRPGQQVTAWPGAGAQLRYLARNVGLMGCVAVAQVPAGLTGWVVSDSRGRRVFVPSGSARPTGRHGDAR